LRTLHWSTRGLSEPCAPGPRPAADVRTPDTILPRGHRGESTLPSPARAAIARASYEIAEVTFTHTPLAAGATPGRLPPLSLAGNR